jgi:hypothetical protein
LFRDLWAIVTSLPVIKAQEKNCRNLIGKVILYEIKYACQV